MIWKALLLVIIASAQPAQAKGEPVAQFISACIDGQVELQSEPERIAYRELPPPVRFFYSRRVSGQPGQQFFRLSREPYTYLLVMPIAEEGAEVDAICVLAAEDVDVRNAYAQAMEAISGQEWEGPPSQGTTFRSEYTNFEQGYRLSATQLGRSFAVLQVSHFSDEGMRSLAKEQEKLKERLLKKRSNQDRKR